MGFAEQLAARAAERQSARTVESCNNSVTSASTDGGSKRSKKRRPRIQPLSDEDFAAKTAAETSHADRGVDGRGGVESNSFADQLKLRANAKGSGTSANQGVGSKAREEVDMAALPPLPSLDHETGAPLNESVKNRVAAAPVPIQMQRNESRVTNNNYQEMHATWSTQIHNLHTIDPNAHAMHQMLKRNQNQTQTNTNNGQSGAKQRDMHQILKDGQTNDASQPSAHDMHQMLKGRQSKQSSRDMQQMLKDSQANNFGRQDDTNDVVRKSSSQQLQQSTVTNNGPTSQVFGAWAQIESLQQRLKEAEERANRECRRAELAELRNIGNGTALAVQSQLAAASQRSSEADEGFVGDLNVESNDVTSKQAGNGAIDRVYKVEESGESLETVDLVPDEKVSAPPCPAPRREVLPQSNIGINTDNDELSRWRQRALQAEERLTQQDFTTLVSPHASTTQPHFQTPQKQHHPAVESDLIQLKNNEISILRHQITRLELRIQEECARNSELLQSYHHGPPIAVAECSLTGDGDTNEFRMLRNEIRHLQYQLSQKNNNRSTQSTTGSTLSSLENEHEEEEDGEEEDGQQQTSSWGLCCVRKSRRGYGRVAR